MSKTNLIHARTCVYNVNYHIVWSVKYRRKVLNPNIEKRLKEICMDKLNKIVDHDLYLEISKIQKYMKNK